MKSTDDLLRKSSAVKAPIIVGAPRQSSFRRQLTSAIAALGFSFATSALAVPAAVTAPIDGSLRLGSTAITGYWVFNQHASGFHTSAGGIGGANDRMAWDINRYLTGNSNADANQPVRAIADGYIDTRGNWSGSSAGQLLLRHTDANGNPYFSGYLHMTNIISKVNGTFVAAGSQVGTVGRTGTNNDHLHFAVYDLVNGVLVSRNTTINERGTLPPVAPPFGISVSPTTGSARVNWAASSEPGTGVRIQISSSFTGFSPNTGWDPLDQRQPTAAVPVNYALNGATQFTWTSGAPGTIGAPAPGATYFVSLRQSVPNRGSSGFSTPISFTMPNGPVTPPVVTDDHGNSIGTATTLAPNASRSGRIEIAGDADYFRINLPASGNYTFASSGSTDTMGDLYDGNGTLLASNDDANGSTNFRIVRSMPSGLAVLRVRGYGSTIGAYSVAVTGQTTPPQPPVTTDDHGNTPASASNLPLGSGVSGTIEAIGDSDYFRFSLGSTATVTIRTTGSTDTMGDLYDSQQTLLASNDDANGTTNFSIVRSLSPGNYTVRVRPYGNNTGAYLLLASASGGTPPQPPTNTDDHGNSLAGATYLPRYSSTAGRIETSGDADWFRFSNTGTSNITFSSSGSTDVVGYLYDRNGNLITSNDDSNGTTNFTIIANLPPGEFFLRIVGYGSVTGSYAVSAR